MTRHRPTIVPTLAIVLAFLPIRLGADTNKAETDESVVVAEAVEATKSWLALIDAGDSERSWERSAALFRQAVTPEQWKQALSASRKPLGDLESRVVKSTQYVTSLPGAPDGQYVVIQFESSFAHKKSAIETVTPMRDPDGVWRVSGYFIR